MSTFNRITLIHLMLSLGKCLRFYSNQQHLDVTTFKCQLWTNYYLAYEGTIFNVQTTYALPVACYPEISTTHLNWIAEIQLP